MEKRFSSWFGHTARSGLPCSMAARTLRLASVPAAKLTEKRRSVLVPSNDY